MIWFVLFLILVAVIACVPLYQEHNRRVMDDASRGAGPGRFAVLPQGVTHYEWHGTPQGPVVICIHGLSTPSFVWRGLTKGLGLMGYRVLTYDLFGRGFSDRPKGNQDTQFFLRQLGDLMTHQEITGKVTLIGYSMGGMISTCFAAQKPDRVERLILLAPAGMRLSLSRMMKFMRDTPVIGDLMMLAAYPRVLRRNIKAERVIPSVVLDVWDQQERELEFKGFVPAILSSFRSILRRDLEAEHQAVREAGIPVLAIWGQNDAAIPLAAMGLLLEWNRDASHEMIEGAGHGLTYTHSDKVLEIIEGWNSNHIKEPSSETGDQEA